VTPGTVRFANGATLRVEIVDKPEEMAKGLMGRTELPESSGMAFWLGTRSDHGFYMKNTKIPLDLIYLDYNKVVGILTLQPMDTTVRRLGRNSSVVIETNAGWSARNGVRVGDSVEISMN
jgi:uncharacterized protein